MEARCRLALLVYCRNNPPLFAKIPRENRKLRLMELSTLTKGRLTASAGSQKLLCARLPLVARLEVVAIDLRV